MVRNGSLPATKIEKLFSSRIIPFLLRMGCVAVCFLGGCAWSLVEAGESLQPCLGNSGQPFQEPEVWRTSETTSPHAFGILEKTLPVQLRECTTDSSSNPSATTHRTYRKQLTGPTIRARAGDRVRILLKNELKKSEDFPPVDDITNLHTHGLHISPTGNSDNVLLSITPESDFQFQFDIPANHPAGTFWYHPHRHGSTRLQVEEGMAGALIIEGDIDEVPAIKAAKEKLFLVQQLRFESGGERVTTVNGLRAPIIHMQPGEVQRWRFIHAGVSGKLRLGIVDKHETKQKLHVIAFDGITIGKIYHPGSGHPDDPEKPDTIEMGPGYRADFMVKLDQPGTYYLKDLPETEETGMFGQAEDEHALATIHVKGTPLSMDLPTDEDLKDLAPFAEIKKEDVINKNFPRQAGFTRNGPNSGFHMNWLPFSSERVDHSLQLGWVETWNLTTDPDSFGPTPPFISM